MLYYMQFVKSQPPYSPLKKTRRIALAGLGREKKE